MPDRGLVLVTGATGAIGPALVEELIRSGYRVRTLSRRPPDAVLPDGVESQEGDITDRAAAQRAADGTAAIFHLAARLHLAGPPSRDIAAYQRVNVDGTEAVVAAAQQADVQRIILASTIGVYGATTSAMAPATESTTPRPETPYASTKLLAEEIVRSAILTSGHRLGTVLRLAAVYGPQVKGNYRTLVEALASRRFVPIGDGRNRRTMVHQSDAVRAMVHALRAPEAAGQTYNVTDGSVHTTDEIVEAICVALGRPSPRWHLPSPLAFGAAAILDGVLGVVSKDRTSFADRLRRYTEDVAVDGSKFQRELGFRPMYSLEEGWKQAISEFRRSS